MGANLSMSDGGKMWIIDGAIRSYTETGYSSAPPHILYGKRCALYFSRSDLESALSDAKKAVELNPGYSDGYSQLGFCYYRLKMMKEALFTFEQLLRIEPKNLDALRITRQLRESIEARKADPSAMLYRAALQQDLDEVNRLIDEGLDVNFQNSDSFTFTRDDVLGDHQSEHNSPLHLASALGSVPIVLRLLEMNANIHIQNSDKMTPLHMASCAGKLDTVR